MNRWDIINHFITKYDYKSYLEIGYFKGWSFDNVDCAHKVAVDPNPSKDIRQERMPADSIVHTFWREPDQPTKAEAIFKCTSDQYFERINEIQKYDIVFIDGLHEASQVYRDIQNALAHLSENGTIVLHDMNPPTYQHTTTGDQGGNWNGDCYKAILRYGAAIPFEYYTIDTDWGVGVIRPLQNPGPAAGGKAFQLNMAHVNFERAQEDWDYFDNRRTELMNIISVEEFLKREEEHATT